MCENQTIIEITNNFVSDSTKWVIWSKISIFIGSLGFFANLFVIIVFLSINELRRRFPVIYFNSH